MAQQAPRWLALSQLKPRRLIKHANDDLLVVSCFYRLKRLGGVLIVARR